jgi:hypothetical protein
LAQTPDLTPEVFADTWPPAVVAKLTELRIRARRELAGDPLSEQRFGYWTWAFDSFLVEAKDAWAKAGVKEVTFNSTGRPARLPQDWGPPRAQTPRMDASEPLASRRVSRPQRKP